MLDVGAAAGFILKGFQAYGWSVTGIEPNPHMAEYARTQLGLQMQTGTLEQHHSSECYDLISMIQVVSHFYDVRQALQAATALTRPGGFWLIETWNRNSWAARAFGPHWQEYSPPSVLHWFSTEGLRHLAAQFGFSEVARGKSLKWVSSEHAKSLLRYKLEDSRQKRFISSLVGLIPRRLALPYPGDDLFWALYQRS